MYVITVIRKSNMEKLSTPTSFKAVEQFVKHLASTNQENQTALDCIFLNYMAECMELFAEKLDNPGNFVGLDQETVGVYMISARDAVEKLNKIHSQDPNILNTLYKARVKVTNQEVDVVVDEKDTCSILGILNGLFPFENGHGAIAVILDDQLQDIEKFALGKDAMEWVEANTPTP